MASLIWPFSFLSQGQDTPKGGGGGTLGGGAVWTPRGGSQPVNHSVNSQSMSRASTGDNDKMEKTKQKICEYCLIDVF